VTSRLKRAYAIASRRAANVAVHSTVGPDDVAATAAAAKEAWYNQRCLCRQLRHRKSMKFWCRMIDADHSTVLQSLWNLDDSLLSLGHMPPSDLIDVETFSRCFVKKVSKVQSSTSYLTHRHSAAFNRMSCLRPSHQLLSMTLTH